MRLAIMQPTFLPWLGWFDIADQVDVLVYLDDVAFSKRSWQQRNRIRTSIGLEYLTVPVVSSGRYGQLISSVEIASTEFGHKLDRTIVTNYSKAEFFGDYFSQVSKVFHIGVGGGSLTELNISLINWMLGVLGIRAQTCRSSSLFLSGKRGSYLANICESFGATEYISTVGAEQYLLADMDVFVEKSINVFLHSFAHPEYRQVFNPFIPYASTLDLILNEGGDALSVIRSGRKDLRALMQESRINLMK